jgi:hypothetical protein
MGQKLLTTIILLSATVATAQYNDRPGYHNGPTYARPYVDNSGYNNGNGYNGNQAADYESRDDSNQSTYNQGAETSQIDNYKGTNEASNTQSSPQINIYNANSNANKQKAATTSEGYANSNSYSKTGYGNNGAYGTDLSYARQNLEYQTNEAAINQIELSRIEDERYRAQKVFNTSYSNNYGNNGYGNNGYANGGYNNNNNGYNNNGNYNNNNGYVNKDNYANNGYVNSSYNYFGYDSFFVAPVIAFMNPPDNVNGDIGYGLQFGTQYATGFSFDSTFLYSNLEMDPYTFENVDGFISPAYQDVDQYSLNIGVHYNFGIGYGITPHVGAVLGYTYRDFQNPYYYNYAGANDSTSSTAVDAGLAIGADLKVSRYLSVGFTYQFMTNITYSRDESGYYGNGYYGNGYGAAGHGAYGYAPYGYRGGGSEPIEEQDKQIFLLTTKWSF